MPEPDANQPDAANELETQLDALIAKVEEAPPPEAPPEAPPETPAEDAAEAPAEGAAPAEADGEEAPPEDVVDSVEAAFDEFEGVFESAQQVIGEIDQDIADETETADEPQAEIEPIATAVEDAPESTAATPETEPEQSEDDLASQIQALLDESSADEAAAFVSPEEVLNESADPPEASPETPEPAEVTAPPAAEAAAEAEAQASDNEAPLIDQIDDLLAGHAEDAIAGEFEDVDTILGVSSAPGENVADPIDDLEEDAADGNAAEAEDDELGGSFESMDDLFNTPPEAVADAAESGEPLGAVASEAANAAPGEDEEEDDGEIDGMFQAPEALDAPPPEVPPEAPPEATPEATPEVSEPAAAAASADRDAEEDDGFDGGFESLDGLLDAPPPTAEDADGAAASTKKPTPAKAAPADAGWSVTISLAGLQAAAMLVVAGTLWACTLINKPVGKLPADLQQAVGWAALAVAGPGLLLIVYGLLLN